MIAGTACTACALLAALTAASPAAEPPRNAIDDLKPGEWLEVPDSHMDQVAFKWPAGVQSTRNGLGVSGVMSCWSGGAYDTKRDRLLVWGGGHFGYAGNEIYAFDVRALKWQRLNDPSLDTDLEGKLKSVGEYPDGKPRSSHSYNYIQYVPLIDRLVVSGTSGGWPFGGGVATGSNTTWKFDFDALAWSKGKEKSPAFGIGTYSAVDPVTGHYYARGNDAAGLLAEWDPTQEKWIDRTGRVANRTDHCKTAAIDPVGRAFVAVGKGLVYRYEVGAPGKIKQDTLTTGGPQDLVGSSCPGFQYDPVLDRFVGWKGGGDLYLLDPATWKWERRVPAASNKVTPAEPNKSGTYGRFRYIPSKNAYVVVNNVNENVCIGRLSDRTAEPIPPRFAEALKIAKDARLVKWVAGQVKLWPEEKAKKALAEALKVQKGSGAVECAAVLEETLEALEKQK